MFYNAVQHFFGFFFKTLSLMQSILDYLIMEEGELLDESSIIYMYIGHINM